MCIRKKYLGFKYTSVYEGIGSKISQLPRDMGHFIFSKCLHH